MQEHLRAVVVEFTRALLDEYDLSELLHRITDHAVTVVEATGAGIMLARGDSLEFAAASDEVVTAVERIQDRNQSGVCHEAFMKNTTLVVADLEQVDGWPEYRSRALELGLRSVLGLPLNARGTTIGVLNVYRDRPGPWSDEDVEAARSWRRWRPATCCTPARCRNSW
ncbi:GAF domain-containing protein [Egicoccus sp. AB-alg6-2]|uniref:GAF domain-containing protein n=1 Tax=Egicoccus sp. AB-alg6-2 TaxID=3242692 RepID=UPI00359EB4B6